VASASNPGNNTVSANVSGTAEKSAKETGNNGNNHDHQKNVHKNHSETGSKSIPVVPPLPALIEKHPVPATNNQHADIPVPHHHQQQQQHKTPQKEKELSSPPALNFGTLSSQKGIHSGTTTADKEPVLSKPVHHDGPSQRKPESPPPGPILFGSFSGVGAHKNENPHPPHHGQQNEEAKPTATTAVTAETNKSTDPVKRSFLDVSTKNSFSFNSVSFVYHRRCVRISNHLGLLRNFLEVYVFIE
jgi:hypothetical protein